jgi:hypothetical protein
VIHESGFERTPPQPLVSSAKTRPAFFSTPFGLARARLSWGRRLAWMGRGCLIVFAGVALINANREAGLLTLGALAQISSPVRGGVQMGLALLLLPLGTLLWLSGRWLLRRTRTRPRPWHLGPWPVVVPLSILLVLTLVHLSPAIGWADVLFVLAGLGLLVLA